MKISSKSDFLARVPTGVKVHEVEIGEDTFFLREMSAKKRSAFDLSLDKKKHPKALERLREKLLIATVSDEAGNLLFDASDEASIADMLAGSVEPLFDKACEINGLKPRDIEDLRKNSEQTPAPV